MFSSRHLVKEINKLQEDPSCTKTKSTYIFLNCGGQIDITETWFYQHEKQIAIYVFDSHRPYHHNNMIDIAKKLHIIDDGCPSLNSYPTPEDIKIITES